MAIATSTILHRHFRNPNDRIRALIIETKSDYEKALLQLPIDFYKVPNVSYSSLMGLDFDIIISQCKTQQYEILANMAMMLHIPIISLDCNLPSSPEDAQVKRSQKAFTQIFNSQVIANAWGNLEAKVIYEPIESRKFNDLKVYNTIFIDIDQQTLPLAQQFSQLWQIGQIPQDNKELESWDEAGIFVNLVGPNPEVLRRIKKALAAGVICLTWQHPLFAELVVPGYNGYLFNNPDELVAQINQLRSKKLEDIKKIGMASHSLIKTKFSSQTFEKEWMKILRNASQQLFIGV